MITYDAVFNKEDDKGVFNLSFVKSPAMKSNFVAFSEDDKPSNLIQFKSIDEEKRMIIGLVLQPNLDIYRFDKDSGKEYNIRFSEQVIEDLMIHYAKESNQNNSSIEHSKEIEGVTFFEHWKVLDPKMDKSVSFGLEFPKGSWLTTAKIDNDEVWNNYVKTGEVLGLSIDGMIGLAESVPDKNINNKNIEMNKDEILEAIKAAFTIEKKEVVKEKVELGSSKSGDVVIQYEGDALAIGGAVWITAPDSEEMIPLPIGDYPLDEKDQILVVTDEGIVGEIKKVEAEVEEELATPGATAAPSHDELIQAIKSVMIKYMEDINTSFELRLAELEKQNLELKSELVAFGEQPAVSKIKTQATKLEYSQMSNREKMEFNRNK